MKIKNTYLALLAIAIAVLVSLMPFIIMSKAVDFEDKKMEMQEQCIKFTGYSDHIYRSGNLYCKYNDKGAYKLYED